MTVPRTISWYVLREVVVYTLLGLAAVSLIFIGTNLARRLADFLMIGVAFGDILTIVWSVMVVTLAYTIPVAFLFGALVGVARMASDSEVLAMRACGLGLKDVILPIFVIGALVSGLCWYIVFEVEHRAKRDLRDTVVAMAAEGRMIEEGQFKQIGERMFYVDSRDRQNRLRGVFIADQSDPDRPLLVFAESGDFRFDAESQQVRVLLRDGDLHTEGREGDPADHFRMTFETFEYSFPVELPGGVDGSLLRPRDLSADELRKIIAHARGGGSLDHLWVDQVEQYEAQLHRRYALPVAPMIFALLAVPLSVGRGRGARSWGILLCGGIMAAYYGVLSFSQYLAFQAVLPSAVALWLPNVVLGAVAAALLWRLRRLPG
jgi:lipopolysaccharide export system permease protein